MRVINYLFGEMLATRVTKAVSYVAFLSMLPNFFDASWHGVSWMNFSMPLVLLAFFATGLFMAFASKAALIDFWRPNTRLGREIDDPTKGKVTVRSLRAVGAGFMIFAIYTIFNFIDRMHQSNGHSS